MRKKENKIIDWYRIKNSRFYNWFWYIHNNDSLGMSQATLLKLAYDDEPYVKTLLHYTYNPKFKFTFSLIKVLNSEKPKGTNYKGKNVSSTYKKFRSILDLYLEGDLSVQEARAQFHDLFITLNRYSRWVYNRVLARDLQIGVRLPKLKRLFPDLFPPHYCNTHYSPPDLTVLSKKFPIILSKFNFRDRAIIICANGSYKIYTPFGAHKKINIEFDVALPDNTVFDGYFSWDKVVVGSKKKRIFFKNRSKVKVIEQSVIIPRYNAVDYIPLCDFDNGKCEMTLRERLSILLSVRVDSDQFVVSPYSVINDHDTLAKVVKDYNIALARPVDSLYGPKEHKWYRITSSRFS